MFCMQCHNDLSECTCADLEERIQRISQSQYILISEEKKKKYMEQAEKNKKRAEDETKLSA